MQKFTVVVHQRPALLAIQMAGETKSLTRRHIEQILDANTSDGMMTRRQVIELLKAQGIDVSHFGIIG
jgi:hypothetical protein